MRSAMIFGSCIALLILTDARNAYSQVFAPDAPMAPRALALAGSNIADATDPTDLNPASSTDTDSRCAAGFLPAPNNLERSWTAMASGRWMPVARDAIAADFSRFQYQDVFARQQVGLTLSHMFPIGARDTGTSENESRAARRASAGLRLRYSDLSFGQNYLPISELSADAGATFDITPDLRGAAVVSHLVSLYKNQDVETQPRTGYLALTYHSSEELTLHVAVKSPEGETTSVLAGIEYLLNRYLTFRIGTETATGVIGGGIGLHYSSMQFDFAIMRHPDLGSTFGFGIICGQ
ncbi:MAG: hypothetical protein Q8922_02515 [Bacteroidota bacterium]|nr:hypothetical protein [Bacteroidota bacterium]MDP4232251.1 hypothetical protein [Bacteroidota bacterium]MDP4242653.1 hypothetical protein [Bacteroidota bacterium]MDP4286785.1 hypothetical protein [Bacteroidota bacterium]